MERKVEREREEKQSQERMAKAKARNKRQVTTGGKRPLGPSAASLEGKPSRTEGLIADCNGTTVDDDVLHCFEILFESSHGEMLRIEALRWMQGIVRADKRARELLMVSGFVAKVIDLLRAEALLCTPPLKCGCVELLSDLCTNKWFLTHSSEFVWHDRTHQFIILQESDAFQELSLLAVQLFRDERTLTEIAASRLLEASCRTLMAVVFANRHVQIAAARSGLLHAAMELSQSDVLIYQRAGCGLIESICKDSPIIGRLALNFGKATKEGTPFLASILHERILPPKLDLPDMDAIDPGLPRYI